MTAKTKTLLQASEFARRAGVTVRTLHHYDRLGLLAPSGRSASGYRLYRRADMARLQQIVTLKFIGLSLSQIKDVLSNPHADVAGMLRLQRAALDARRRHLDAAVRAIEAAERVAGDADAGWEAFAHVVEVIEMEKHKDWIESHFSPEQLADIERRNTPGVAEQGALDWKRLFADIEAAIAAGVDPASADAASFVDRWDALVRAFTGGDPKIHEGLNAMYSSPAPPAGFTRPWSDEVDAFIAHARAAKA